MTFEEEIGIKPGTVVKYVLIGIVALIALIALFNIAYTVQAGHRAVLLTWGKPNMVSIGEGLHAKWPFAQNAVIMDVQTQKYEADLSAASSDLQDVKTKIAINYHLVPEDVPAIYRDIGVSYAEKVIYPLEQETNKAATAQYTAEQLITKRDEVREKMKTNLREKLQVKGIIVEEISIINFEFSPSFTQAIELKVTAEQNALAAKNKLAQVEYEAQQRITQASAEAEAIRIQAQAIQAQGGKDYVQLQAISKWNGVLPTITTSGVVPFINIAEQGK